MYINLTCCLRDILGTPKNWQLLNIHAYHRVYNPNTFFSPEILTVAKHNHISPVTAIFEKILTF